MSRRPDKKINRLRRLINKTENTTTWIDLIHWLKFRRYANTTGQAIEMLMDGRVKAGPNAVGRTYSTEHQRWVLWPYCSAALRKDLHVSNA